MKVYDQQVESGAVSAHQGRVNAPGKRSSKPFGMPFQWKDKLVYTLSDWWVKQTDVYTAPECAVKIICGRVFGHPRFPDGSFIESSEIKDAKGRYILTSKGTVYKLHGRPHRDYVKWMKENGIAYDGYEPVRIRRIG